MTSNTSEFEQCSNQHVFQFRVNWENQLPDMTVYMPDE